MFVKEDTKKRTIFCIIYYFIILLVQNDAIGSWEKDQCINQIKILNMQYQQLPRLLVILLSSENTLKVQPLLESERTSIPGLLNVLNVFKY